MRHYKKGSESLNTLTVKVPRQMNINGQLYLNFKDVFYNLLLNNLQQTDFTVLNQKIQKLVHGDVQKNNKKPMSKKHKLRLEKQLRKASGMRK